MWNGLTLGFCNCCRICLRHGVVGHVVLVGDWKHWDEFCATLDEQGVVLD